MTLEAATLAEIDRLATEGPTDPTSSASGTCTPPTPLRRSSGSVSGPTGSRCTRLFDEPERVNAEVSRYTGVDAGRVGAALRDSVRADNRRDADLRPRGAAS